MATFTLALINNHEAGKLFFETYNIPYQVITKGENKGKLRVKATRSSDVPYNRTGAQLLFDYLSEIHEKKVIILNTNLEFSRWVNVLYDEQMTAALVGRLMHHCHLILFPGENNRLRESSINDMFASRQKGGARNA